MYKIYVKTDRDPIIEKDNSKGAAIKAKFEASIIAGDTQFKIDNWTGYKSDIRSVTYFHDEAHSEAQIANQHSKENYKKHRHEMLSLPKTELAKNMQYFGFVYQILSQKNYRDDIELVREVYKLQLKFFTENKNVILPDPAIFSDIFKSIKSNDIATDDKEGTTEKYIHMKSAGFNTFSQAYIWEQRYAGNV